MCRTWYHLICSKVSHKKYLEFNKGTDTEDWICDRCYKLPFNCLSDVDFHKLNNPQDKFELFVNKCITKDDIEFTESCPICKRRIQKNKLYKAIPCFSCNCLVHRKCSGLLLSELNFMKDWEFAYWECEVCMIDKFPFSTSDTQDLLQPNFN